MWQGSILPPEPNSQFFPVGTWRRLRLEAFSVTTFP